jgi:hypothetical protein
MSSPTQRSLKLLRDEGYTAAVVEKWNRFANVRQDLFGFIDILGIKRGEIVGVQSTTADNMSARIRKITDHENVGVVREAGIRIVVHGWRKDAKTKRWICKQEDLS